MEDEDADPKLAYCKLFTRNERATLSGAMKLELLA
jgi:hypothetical protein